MSIFNLFSTKSQIERNRRRTEKKKQKIEKKMEEYIKYKEEQKNFQSTKKTDVNITCATQKTDNSNTVVYREGLPPTSKGMEIADYVAVVGPLTRPYWVHPDLSLLTGIDDFFSGEYKVSKKLTKEEYEKCYIIISNMIEVYVNVSEEFGNESNKLMEKYPLELRNGKVYVSEEKQKYHSTETVIELLRKHKDDGTTKEVPECLETEYENKINSTLDAMKQVEFTCLGLIMMSAHTKFFSMII